MRKFRILPIVLSALLACASCAKSGNVIVLLPDAEGKTGRILVSNQRGSLTLDAPNQATVVPSADAAPSPARSLDEEKIRENFGPALDVFPSPPIHFTLYFKTGTAELTDESREKLSLVRPALEERSSTDVSVVGHTDRVGRQKDNFSLGLKRASMVQQILVSIGIDHDYIEIASHGEDNPLINTDDGVAEPKNRRVEVIVR